MQRPWGRSDLGMFENRKQTGVAGGWGTRGNAVGDEGRGVSRDQRKVLGFHSERDGWDGGESEMQWKCLVFLGSRLLEAVG